MKNTIFDLSCAAFVLVTLLLLLGLFSLDANSQSVTVVKQITSAAVENDIDPALALAIAEVESQFNTSAVGGLGEIGLYQLRPEFHRVVRGQTEHNIKVAMRYLATLKRRCGGYGDAFFVCYNYGHARKLKHPHLFPYYKKVKAAQLRILERLNVIARTD